MRATISSAAALMMMAGAALAQGGALPAGNAWYDDAQAMLEARLSRQPNTSRARNIIIMIADGNGVSTNYAIRLWHGQQNGNYGEENVLPYEAFPHLALAKTYTVNAQSPDSAGTGTAIMTGVKTRTGVIGVDETLIRGDCAKVGSAAVASIGDLASGAGKAVGYVSTARITHATPAAGYAKSADRHFESDRDLPEWCDSPDIAAQLITRMMSGDVRLAMGGGRRNFIPAGVMDEEGRKGRRTDGRDLIEEARGAGVQYAWNDETAAGLTADAPVLALFEASHMHYEHDRSGEPSLAEMTAKAIEVLSADEDGFFLQVEAGRVDHAHHDGNLHRVVTDGAAFAEAVAVADAMTDDADTLIIVTADHEHAIAFMGYCGRGTPVTGLCYGIDRRGIGHDGRARTGADGKPYTVAGYLNGAGSILKKDSAGDYGGQRPDLTQEQATDPDYRQQALVPKSSGAHSGEDVAIYAKGPFAHLVSGTVEQNYIFNVMHHAMTAE